mmetsp:Transcript_25197/g.74957  ORF Transcript_25197/g.74957 Transcript_25197/m.74957 type:complete len:535 (+) Transcript_25197:92-1696(+)
MIHMHAHRTRDTLHDKDDTCGDPDSLREGGPSLVEHEHHKLRQRHLAVLVLVGDRHHRGDLLSGGGGVDDLDGGGELGVRDGAVSVRVDLVERVGQLAARRRPRAALLLRAEGLPPLLGLGHVLRLRGEACDARLDRGAHDRGVGTPRGDHAPLERVGRPVEGGLRVRAPRLHPPLLLHPHHLVAHDLAPVRAVLVGLHHRHCRRLVVDQQHRLLLAFALGRGALGALHVEVEGALLGQRDALVRARAHHHHPPPVQLVRTHNQPERRQRRRVVLNQPPVVHAEHAAARHAPPRHCLLADALALGRVDGQRVIVAHVAAVASRGRVHLDEGLAVAVHLVVVVRVDADLVPAVLVGDGGVEPDGASVCVVDRQDLEPRLVAAQQARLAPSVARAAAAHHSGLHKDARSAVRVRALFPRHRREGDRVLVVVREMEVSREPPLDAAVPPDELDELARRARVRLLAARVVQPAAAVDDVVLLQHPQPGADRRRVRKHEDLPPLLGGVLAHQPLEPGELLVVDCHLVARVLCRAEDCRA